MSRTIFYVLSQVLGDRALETMMEVTRQNGVEVWRRLACPRQLAPPACSTESAPQRDWALTVWRNCENEGANNKPQNSKRRQGVPDRYIGTRHTGQMLPTQSPHMEVSPAIWAPKANTTDICES